MPSWSSEKGPNLFFFQEVDSSRLIYTSLSKRSMLSVKEGKLGLMSLGESANGGILGGWMNE